MVILCFERRFSKQNKVIRLKSNIFPQKNFWAGYVTGAPMLALPASTPDKPFTSSVSYQAGVNGAPTPFPRFALK